MSAFKVLATGSEHGNATLLFNETVLVDAGVTFNVIKPYVSSISLVLLTHEHTDHLNLQLLVKLRKERPSVVIMCTPYMARHLDFLVERYNKTHKTQLDNFEPIIVEPDTVHERNGVIVSPFNVYHDVPNVGWKIWAYSRDTNPFKLQDSSFKVLYVTDTSVLPENLNTVGYHLYLIEANYDENTVKEHIEKEIADLGYSHRMRALHTHHSLQQAEAYIKRTSFKGRFIPLHMSSVFEKEIKEKYWYNT